MTRFPQLVEELASLVGTTIPCPVCGELVTYREWPSKPASYYLESADGRRHAHPRGE
jgi:hypothetical protein